jgi:hypothetical protein
MISNLSIPNTPETSLPLDALKQGEYQPHCFFVNVNVLAPCAGKCPSKNVNVIVNGQKVPYFPVNVNVLQCFHENTALNLKTSRYGDSNQEPIGHGAANLEIRQAANYFLTQKTFSNVPQKN